MAQKRCDQSEHMIFKLQYLMNELSNVIEAKNLHSCY